MSLILNLPKKGLKNVLMHNNFHYDNIFHFILNYTTVNQLNLAYLKKADNSNS